MIDQAEPRYGAVADGNRVHLSDSHAGVVAVVVPEAGNVVSSLSAHGHELLRWPYASIDDFHSRPAWHGLPLLAPWANRLDEAAFYANGVRYALDPDLAHIRGPNHLHGFLSFAREWSVVSSGADHSSAWVTSRLEVYRRPDWMRQFPFAHTIAITHRVADGALRVSTTLENLSAEPMPVAIGFHPYFHLTDSPRDAWTLSLPAQRQWRLSDAMLPTGETVPTDAVFADRRSIALAGARFDDVFTDLDRDEAGVACVTVRGRAQQLDVTIGPRYKALVIYSPPPAAGDRGFICVEPMAAITNAFNLAHRGLYHDLQHVPAGGTWQETFSVKPSGF